MKRGPCSEHMAQIYNTHVQQSVVGILQSFQIVDSSIGLWRRWPRQSNPSKRHTLWIETQSDNSSQWKAAAIRIYGLFVVEGLTSDDIEVEITNPSRTTTNNISYPLPADESLLNALESVKQPMYDLVDAFLAKQWSSIAFHMRRPRSRPSAAQQPTVLIYVFEDACADFNSFESQAIKLLSTLDTDISLEILPGSVTSTAIYNSKPLIFLSPPPFKPTNGASIGTGDDRTEAGTLGGWVIYRAADGKPVRCGLTCYHVVASHDPAVKRATDSDGVRPDKAEGKISVHYPSIFDMVATRNRLEARERETGDPHDEDDIKILAYINERMKDPSIGRVLLASGQRKNKANHRMDWALFESAETFKINKPTPESAFTSAEALPWPRKYKISSDSKIRQFGSLAEGDWVAKQGRTSGYTSGTVNRMRRRVTWANYSDFVSEEIEVLGLTTDFADHGDSGSFVTNIRGELVGLVIGRESNSADFDIGFVTPIEDIQQDVKEMSGGFISLED